jgi:membrane protease YdiL (CAAX protease family)
MEGGSDLLLALGVLLLVVLLTLATTPLLVGMPVRWGAVAQQLGCLLLPALLAAYLTRRGPGLLALRGAALGPLLLAALFTPFLLLPLTKLAEVTAPFLPDTEELALALEELVRADGAAELAAVLVVAALLPALAEEVMFRGLLLRALCRRFGATAGIVLQAVLFALAHVHPARIGPMVLLGCFLGWAVARTGSVWTGVAGHAVFNGLIVLMVNAAPERPPGPAVGPPWEWALGSLAVFLCGVLALAVATRRTDAGLPGLAEPRQGGASEPDFPPGGGPESDTMEPPEGVGSEVSR